MFFSYNLQLFKPSFVESQILPVNFNTPKIPPPTAATPAMEPIVMPAIAPSESPGSPTKESLVLVGGVLGADPFDGAGDRLVDG